MCGLVYRNARLLYPATRTCISWRSTTTKSWTRRARATSRASSTTRVHPIFPSKSGELQNATILAHEVGAV
eukprot:scaffold714_cov121-Isochrysis_galbana.AAC.15